EAEHGSAHRLDGDIAGEDHQVRPRNLGAVLLLDRPEQAARLVEVAVVRPGVERSKALLPASAAAASVSSPICAGRVPGHADEEGTVVAIVSWPPALAVSHQGAQVLDHRVEVETFEFLGVVE